MTARPKTLQEIKRLKDAVDHLMIAWLAMGLTIGEIAANLKRTDKVVQWRWLQLKKRYGFRCYQDATRYAIKEKLIPLKIRYD